MRLRKNTYHLLGLSLTMFAFPALGDEGGIQDAESASHGTEAAWYGIVDRYSYPGFDITQFELGVLSHFSYTLVSGEECLVVDPGRDIATYLEFAKEKNAKIVGVWLSHSHADFIAGHTEFAKDGIPILISSDAGAQYAHQPLQEGSTFAVGDALLTFRATPGHTPDGMCAQVSHRDRPEDPDVLFSGDTLFVGSVGRPDLMGEGMSASTLAAMMFDTWNEKLSLLADDVVVLPAHGAGSLCGAHLSDEPSGTIGEQRVSNPYFAHESRGTFIAAVLEGLPEAPAYFKHNAAANRRGPEAVAWDAAPTMIAASEDLMDPAQYYVVDMRDAEAYAAGHVPNSINIALRGRFETWTGIMVPWDARLVLVGDEAQMSEALLRLHRVGYHGACLTFGAWKEAGLPVRKNNMCPPQDLYEAMQAPDSPIVIDVRLPNEWMALRIGTIVNIPLSTLAEDAKIIARTEKVVTVCNSAYRSSMALGVLERLGFEKVCSLAGGSQAWLDAGLPVYEARGAGAAAAAPKRYVRLAERLSAAELKRMLLDVPGTFSLVDIRPPEQFADYRLPGAVNVAVADLLEDQGWLVGVGPLVVVDRDGSLAMMVAGILSQKTERTIKAVYGGLSAYWTESELPASGAFSGSSPAPSAPVPSPTATPATTPAKKKSAGC